MEDGNREIIKQPDLDTHCSNGYMRVLWRLQVRAGAFAMTVLGRTA